MKVQQRTTVSYRKISPAGIAVALAYAVVLGVSHVYVISPWFAYDGFTLGNPDPLAIGISALSLVVAASQLPAELTRPSQVVYWGLFLFAVAPIHVVPLLLNLTGRPSPLPIIIMVSAAFTALSWIYRVKPPQLLTSEADASLFWTVVGGLTLACLALVVYGFGFHFQLPSFGEVYDVRAEYQETAGTTNPLSAYSVAWVCEVFGPLLIGAGLTSKRRALTALGIGCQLFVYSLTGLKSVVMLMVMLFAVAALSRKGKREIFGKRLLFGAFAVTLAVTLYDIYQGTYNLSTILTRRLSLVPGMLTYFYYEHFSDRPKPHFDYSFLKVFSDNPYPIPPATTVGQVYFGSQTNANANLWADGYANFGILGVLVMTLLLGAYMLAFDGMAVGRDLRLATIMITGPGLTLVNSALSTALLTQGMLLALLLLAFMPKSEQSLMLPKPAARSR